MSKPILFRFITPARTEAEQAAPVQVEWLAEASVPEQGTLDELAVQAANRRLVLAAPAEAVTLTRTRVPGQRRSMLRQAIPYAVEDSLAEDVEALHFALGETTADGEVVVAIVRRAALEAWLGACADGGIAPHAVVPEFLLLPFEPDAWSVLVEDDRALVRSGPGDGFATERDNLDLLLELALTEAGAGAPPRLRVWGEWSPPAALAATTVQHEDDHPLRLLASGIEQRGAINLLQGAYGRGAHLGRWLRPWRTAAVLAGLWLGLQAAMQLGEYWQLRREQAAIEAEMVQIYKDAVPDAVRIVNPRVQLDHRLQQLSRGQSATAGQFLDLLYQGGQVLTELENFTLRALRYKEQQLDLDLEAASLEVLDRLRQRFAEQPGVSVEMRTTKREDKVESQLTLRRAPS